MHNIMDDLISQLQTTNQTATAVATPRLQETVTKDNLEDYVIQKSSALVTGTIDMVDTVRDYIVSAPESKDVSSLAELINAATNAVETLNKIVLSNKKNTTLVKVKEMDIASKKELQDTNNEAQLRITREEAFKLLAANTKPIEAEIIESKPVLEDNS